jgi:hypothetical protein
VEKIIDENYKLYTIINNYGELYRK